MGTIPPDEPAETSEAVEPVEPTTGGPVPPEVPDTTTGKDQVNYEQDMRLGRRPGT